MNSPDILTNHEIQTNKAITFIYLGLCSFPVIILIMSIFKLYNYDTVKGSLGVVCSLILSVVLFVFYKIKKESKAFKYIAIFSIQFIIFLYSTDVNIQITVLYMLAPFFALLYFNPGFTFAACILSFISMIAGTCLSARQATEIIWPGVSPFMYIVTTGSGRVLEHIFVTAILVTASKVASRIMQSLELRNRKISFIQNDIVFSFADMIESRDGLTGEHVKRTSKIVSYITKYISSNAEDVSYKISDNELDLIALAAPLHDIGKMNVPDAILCKKGKLTDEEFEIIKTHPVEGAKLIAKTLSRVENPAYVRIAKEMALYHHEKWNGQGYPEKLKGDEIPVSARIMAVADVFDALCSVRSYKPAYTIDEAFKIMEESKGSHFEPQLVDIMFKLKPYLEQIYNAKS